MKNVVFRDFGLRRERAAGNVLGIACFCGSWRIREVG